MYTKVVKYRDYNIKIMVKLNAMMERRIDGEIYHTIETEIKELKYFVSATITDKLLEYSIIEAEDFAKQYINTYIDKPLSRMEEKLISMGFNKN